MSNIANESRDCSVPVFEVLEPRLLLSGSVVISEFMASNDTTLLDGDDNSSDWIELYNPTDSPVDVAGWFLTDDMADLTQWEFPTGGGIDTTLEPGEYRVIMASGEDGVYPYVDSLDYLHTNFTLSRNDGNQHESVVLVRDDRTTVEHKYEDYPEQTRDVSYGSSSAASTTSVLLASDAAARYHVPAAGEDPTGWTAESYDDSSWTDAVEVGSAGLLVTEISTGGTKFIEIQNVSHAAIDASGWTVLVNDASGGINSVNSVAWSLPGTIDSAAVLYKTDDAGDGINYWGGQIDWGLEGPGWAMIVDGSGSVMDFVAWGYSEAEIASLDISYGGFAHITVSGDWSGPSAAPGTADPGITEGFVAFNDHIIGGATHANATTYAANVTASGVLKDITDGSDTPVTLTTSQTGVTFETAGSGPAAETDAYEVFNGYVDFTVANDCSLATSTGDNYTHTFSGLETGGQITYSFVGTAIRGGSNYTNRWTLVTIDGAESFTLNADYSVDRLGVITHAEAPGEVAENQVAIWTGHNSASGQGFVAAWTGINPGDDGVFSIISRQYTGSIPVGSGTADASKGYSLAGIRLEELAPVGPLAVLKRIGDSDGDAATDFIRTTIATPGAENPELTVPFGRMVPVLTPIGFSDGNPEFDEIIGADVAGDMEGVNGSLWSRIEFWADDLSVFETLTLRMKYDDGFAVWLNGVEVASRNAPGRNGQDGDLAWNSNATDTRPEGLAVVFEDIDISGHLGDLNEGANVLAVHGLNADAADSDFLILPNVVVSGTQHIEQHFFDPTPGGANSSGAVVINEIHYDPEDSSQPGEFIELYNNTLDDVDLTGWRLTDAIAYQFPQDTTILAGQYLVVAQDSATVQAEFGAAALGPWTGRLDNEGESVVLLDESGIVRDEVDYSNHFPWPVGAQGQGSSMELINPVLANDLGGSWRSSGYDYSESQTTFVPSHSSEWHYRKGISEASDPTDAWRGAGFVEDGTWLTGQTVIGYGDGDDTTLLDDMEDEYSSLYLRHSFQIDSQDDIPGALQLRVYVDDGCIVWINGNEVEPRFYVTGGFKAYNDFAQGHEAGWTQVNVSPGFLVVGENTIAIHALNATLSSSDFSIDAELTGVESTTAGGPSPGQQNNVWALNAAPQVRKVSHGLQQPASGQPATITAKITDPNGVASAMLHYQVVLPGEYIPAYLALTHSELMADPDQPRAENPAFEDPANWTTVAMADNATGGDATAGDDIYTAVIPGRINRTLVRYRITVTDSFGQSARAPYSDDPSLNFAYYVYDGVPDYVAETRSIDPEGAGHVYSSEELTSLPVYSLIARSQDMVEMLAYDSAYQVPQTSDQAIRRAYNWQAAFVYDGVVYDHVDMRLRGANGRYYQAGKRSMRIRFKRGNYLQARDENGVEYPTKWRQLVVSKMFGNKNDANYGLAETVNNEMWNLAGVPAPETHWFHFRVVDGAEEVPSGANAQYYGDFWGMFMAFEPYDVRFLEAHDLPKGNLYKLTNAVSDGNLQQRYQAIDAPTDAEDYNNIRSNLNSSRDEDWLHSYVNYDEWYRYHTVAEAIKHYDYWPGANKNMSWYFEPDETNPMGRLWYLPFDSDASWGPTWNGGEDEAKRAIGGKPEMQMAYRNTIREFRDLIFQPEVIEPWIDRTASVISDFWQADYDRWEDAPSDAGRHSWDGHTLWWKVADMKNFAFVGGSWPGGSVGAGGQAAHLDQLANADGDATSIPYTPSLWYTGPAGFAIDSLVFQCGAFSDPQGDGEFAGMEWRIGEITDPGAPAYDPDAPHAFEYTALWRSGELTSFNDTIAVPGYDLAAGHAYRVRVRMKDTTGRWSHWSAPVQFVAGDADPYIPENLRITELNYHPYEPTAAEISEGYARDQDFEFVELQNTGDRTMDLTRVRFMQGVTFDFTGGGVTSLAPGQRVIVARNSAAFAFRYGPGIAVAGQYVSGLNDTGEQILLVGPYNRAAVEFVWSNSGSWPGKADGKGATLTIVDPAGEYGDPDNWQSSVAYGGTPGESPHAEPGVVVNEVVSHTDEPDVDTIELHNTTDQTVNIGGWFLSDSWGWESNSGNGNYKKFQIPFDTEIGPYGYLLFDEDDFNASGGAGPLDFALNGAHGDDVWLMKADSSGNLTHFADHVDFGAAANGESFGRWPDGQGGPYPMMSVTPGGANSGPRIGPLIITEVMYNPPDPDGAGPMVAGDLEFIELYNPTGQAVELSAWEDNPHTPGQYLADWRIRGGVDVEFDEGATIGAGETLVVLPFDPNIPANAIRLADFRGYYGIDVSVAAVGGYDGLLDGGGDRITLQRPDSPPLEEVNFVPHLLEDEVRYDDQAPWPSIADGGGQSLHRRAPSLWGGDAANWNAAAPNPGMVVFDEPFVLGRHIFYNNSAWDNNNPLPEAFDDDAIAADKLVLLPGQGASAVNYTNYFRGINGVMVDIYALPGDPTTGDFGIRVNEAASPDTWSDGPAPTVSVRAGEGVGGSDRVTLIWADSAILNQWVEVTVLSDGNGGSLGLAENDVFYLGNSIGDCDGNGEVGSSDYGVLVGEFGRRGGIDVLAADVNGDGRVDLSDFATMRGAIGNSVLTPSFPAAAPDAPVAAPGGEAELDVLAIPAAVTSVNPEIMNPETVNPGSASDQSGRLATGNWQLATGEDLTAKPYGNGVAPRHVKAAPGRRTPNNDVAPAVDLLMPSPSPAGYISRPQAISGGSPAATLQRAATGEYDLQPLSDDSLALSESNGETNAPGDDLLADILAESALAVQL